MAIPRSRSRRRGPGDFAGVDVSLASAVLEPGLVKELERMGSAADRLLAAAPLAWLRGVGVDVQKEIRKELGIATLIQLAEFEGPLPASVTAGLNEDARGTLERARAHLRPCRPLVTAFTSLDVSPILAAGLLTPRSMRTLASLPPREAARQLAQTPLEHVRGLSRRLIEALQSFHGFLTLGHFGAYRGPLDPRVLHNRTPEECERLEVLRPLLRPPPDPTDVLDVAAALAQGVIAKAHRNDFTRDHAATRFAGSNIEVLDGLSPADLHCLHALGIHRVEQFARLCWASFGITAPHLEAIQRKLRPAAKALSSDLEALAKGHRHTAPPL